jgi:hypothetical protein
MGTKGLSQRNASLPFGGWLSSTHSANAGKNTTERNEKTTSLEQRRRQKMKQKGNKLKDLNASMTLVLCL